MVNRGSIAGKHRAAAAALALCALANSADAREISEVATVASRGGLIDVTTNLALPSPFRQPADADAPTIVTPRVTFGRAMDIVGVPINFARMVPRNAGVRPVSGLGLGGSAVLSNRLPLVSARVSSRFGMRRHPLLGAMRNHSGVDLAAPQGTPVYAPAAGKVAAAQWRGGYGLLVAIDHAGGMETRYGHLFQIAVVPGQSVAAGEVIGYVGSTGLSTGPHLHYEVRIHGAVVNPLGN